jgi:YidC/Oxa1 family membrane protein insertase
MIDIFGLVKSGFLGVLVELYKITGNLGFALIIFTLVIRFVLMPLSLQSLRAQKKIQQLQPELAKLKKKHGSDKQALQAAQMEMYKSYNVNPLAGCIPQLFQIGLFILLYQALQSFLHSSVVNGVTINPQFFWLNLSAKDPFFILPVLAAVTQLILSLMVLPATETPDEVPNQSKNKKTQKANEKEEDVAEMAASMQQSMVYVLPFMIGISAANFPSGLGLYWVTTTLFSIAQQYFLSGPGGLMTYVQRATRAAQSFFTKSSK